MENFEMLKNKLIRAINESSDRNLILNLWKLIEQNKNPEFLHEPSVTYGEEKPMTDQEVEDYFKEEEIVLPAEILEILKMSEEDIKAGRTKTNEEVQAYFNEWLKN